MIFTDQLNNKLEIRTTPKRIISLLPSQTELLFYLGLAERIVGTTKFCIHPTEFYKTKQFIGGTKQINFELVHSLKPDLIIANKEENSLNDITELQKHYPVWLSDVNNLSAALEMIISIGEITGAIGRAMQLKEGISNKFINLRNHNLSQSAAYLIWDGPMMVAANNTFINDMLPFAGFKNIFNNNFRYPIVTIEEILEAEPEFILLSSEPYPFKEKHKIDFQKKFPRSIVKIVDGEMFSWYGNRLLLSADYFSNF